MYLQHTHASDLRGVASTSEQAEQQEKDQGSDMVLIQADFRISLGVVNREKVLLTPAPVNASEC
jgi:hypothetical protein